ncbi:AI-2E family transporter [Paenibacillus sp. MER TA 81-3]|uniref:AI-2E family transporter n=1 Tax=Paenibacillus sp. MER TA 81-3 TaxID=2939573 RepID=UPI00203F78F3|nr:AI-2E family transporter [Paenibacillus sp. MER TA 81-3]MCM3339497.1 AI-2E family transporter [Paenibacillus sp. MER TA 81-3]
MIVFYQKYWRTAFDIALLALTVYLVMYTFSFLYSIAAPIFLAFIVFMLIEPFAAFLNRRGIKKAIASAISVLLFVLIILGAIFGLGFIFLKQAAELQERLPQYVGALQHGFVNITTFLTHKYETLPIEVTGRLNEYVGIITKEGSKIAINFLAWLTNNISSFSAFTLNFGIAIILAYFLSIEIDMWRRIARDKTPRTFQNAYHFLKENVLRGIGAYLKAQMKLISVTFSIIFVSLLLLGVDHAFFIGLLSALFDLLPLLGIPFIFIPWIVYLFIIGNSSLAIWLTVVLGLTLLVRQILDPKITGNTLGVSGFTMLSFMILSLSMFGVIGVVLSPILLILVKALYDQGYLKEWIRMPKEEFISNPFDASPDVAKEPEEPAQPTK